MTAAQYRAHRQRLGTWKEVAAMLGVTWRTIARREAGGLITTEAALAIKELRKPKPATRKK